MLEAERELRSISGQDDVRKALAVLGILRPDDEEFELVGGSQWERGGSETYLLRFGIRATGADSRFFLFKACTPFPGSGSVESVLATWLERRRIIDDSGISTPALYGVGQGVVLEEFVEHELRSQIRKSSDLGLLLAELGRTLGTLTRLGYAPVDALSDLRSRGTDVVIIDFGQDLGPPGVATNPPLSLLDTAVKTVLGWRPSISAIEHATLEATYRRAAGDLLT